MKKIVCIILCSLLVFSLSACGGDISRVNTHNVNSEIYSQEDINAAIDTIKKEFMMNWDVLLQRFIMQEMTALKTTKTGQIGTMQMKSLFYYLHSMLIHPVETGL